MRALVLGAGISGKSANKLLKKLGYVTYILDDNKILFHNFKDKLIASLSMVVVSPGVEQSHETLALAREHGIEIIGELELGSRFISCPIIAITGTNGKTTTTTLTGELLSPVGRVFVGGNIGVPVTSFALSTSKEDVCVLEVSSFQLETIKSFKPHIALLLNLSVDHLSRHKTYENYINAKLRIFENQTESDFAVFNYDDKTIMGLDLSFIKAQKFYFSTKVKCKGCYVQKGMIYFNDGENVKQLFSASEITLRGEHNLANALASILACILAGMDKNIREKIHKFKGISHRLEYIAEINGVTFINDSKSTNISSCKVAISSMSEPTTLILGGSDKGFSFDELFEDLPAIVKNIVVVGQTKSKIIESSRKYAISNVYEAESFKDAVMIARNLASAGETVLLSPACASFDMFDNYEQRGEVFAKIVREIEKSENRKVPSKKAKKVSS